MLDLFRLSEVFYLFALLLFVVETAKLMAVWMTRKYPDPHSPHASPFISVIIPVRNEEARIARCLSAITGQTYPPDRFEIIVADDHSDDQSRNIIESFRDTHHTLRVIASDPLPDGWDGKSFANHQAAKQASGEFLVFMDADVFAKPNLLGQLVNHTVKHRLDVVSIIPFRLLRAPFEKILLTPIFIPIAIAFREKKVKLSGELILFRRSTYEAIGGHAAIKSTVSDDLDFAALLEKTSFRTDILFAEHLAGTHMYSDFQAFFEGISKFYQRILSENEWLAAWRSTKYFLFALLSIAAICQYYYGHGPQILPQWTLLLLPTLLLLVFTSFSFYVKINPHYALLMPLGWLFQPVLFFRSLLGKHRHYHLWRGRRVHHNTQQVSDELRE